MTIRNLLTESNLHINMHYLSNNEFYQSNKLTEMFHMKEGENKSELIIFNKSVTR